MAVVLGRERGGQGVPLQLRLDNVSIKILRHCDHFECESLSDKPRFQKVCLADRVLPTSPPKRLAGVVAQSSTTPEHPLARPQQ